MAASVRKLLEYIHLDSEKIGDGSAAIQILWKGFLKKYVYVYQTISEW